jgi:deoxycytidine triphosphate deaminase
VLCGKIDVSEHGAFDFLASKYWKERKISIKKPLKIRPNETVFGRTHEKLVVPENCCAKIEVKSSIARLALSVTYSDYCNPKYIGHYPLQIHNSGKNTVILYPNMEICQLILVKINDKVSINYDDNIRKSIYAQFDDGSPSKWWDTKTNKEMRKRFFNDYGSDPIDQLMNKIDKAIIASFGDSLFIEYYKKQVYKRLKKFLGRIPNISTDITFERFFRKEERKRRFFEVTLGKILISATPVILSLLISISIFVIGKFMGVLNNLNVLSIVVVVLCIILTIGSIIFSQKIFSKLSDYVESYLIKQE